MEEVGSLERRHPIAGETSRSRRARRVEGQVRRTGVQARGQPQEPIPGTAQDGGAGEGPTDACPSRCPGSAMTHCVSPRGVSLSPATAAWVQFILPPSEQPASQTRATQRSSPLMKEGCHEERYCAEIYRTVPGSNSVSYPTSLFLPSCSVSPALHPLSTCLAAGWGGGCLAIPLFVYSPGQ